MNGGSSWEYSVIQGAITTTYSNATYGAAGIYQDVNPATSIRRSWWSYMTGRGSNGQRAFTKWGSNGDGVGGWGTKSDSWGRLRCINGCPASGAVMVERLVTITKVNNKDGYNIGKGRRVGGGAGAGHMYYSSGMSTAVNNAS